MKGKKITREIQDQIFKLSEFKSQKEIAKLFNLTQSGISVLLRRHNITWKKSRLNMSRLKLNINYFKNIDDSKKAYWLGYICADGYVNKKGNKLILISKDFSVISKFKKDIKSDHKIYKKIYNDNRTGKTYISYMIQIGNELFVENIIKLGISNSKTDVLSFPKIDENLYSFFIAGLFDGDGYIGYVNNRLRISLISTKEILEFIQNLLLKNFDVKKTTLQIVTNNKSNVYKMYLYKDSMIFLKLIYNCNFKKLYLKRKYKIYEKNLLP